MTRMVVAKPISEWTEKEWQHVIIGTKADPGPARMFGWKAYHVLRSKGSEAGFPDWFLVRERVVMIELKTESKASKLSPAQVEWVGALIAAGVEVYVGRPRSFDALGKILAHRGRPNPDNPYYIELMDELEKEMTR